MPRSNFLAILLTTLFVASPSSAQNRPEILRKLRIVQENINLNISQINKLIQQQMLATQTIRINQKRIKSEQNNLEFMLNQVSSLKTRMEEQKQRLYLLDRIIFQVDSKFTPGTQLKTFMEQQLLDMAYTDFLNNGSTWRFSIYLSVAIRELYNPHEDIVGFIEGYINFSTIENPRTPFEFIHEGNYSNGSEVTSGNPIPQEDVGAAWEAQVQKMTGDNKIPEQTPAIEERIKLQEIITDQTLRKTPSIFDEATLPEGQLFPSGSVLGLDYE